MSIILSEILPPADQLFSDKELEEIFLQAVKLASNEQQYYEEFTSIEIESVELNDLENTEVDILHSLKGISTNFIVHYQNISDEKINSENAGVRVSLSEDLYEKNIISKNFNLEGVA